MTYSVRYIAADGSDNRVEFGDDRGAAWAFMRLCSAHGVAAGFPAYERDEARVFHNLANGALWMRYPDGSTASLDTAHSAAAAAGVLSAAGVIRTGDWLIEYGQVRSASVQTAPHVGEVARVPGWNHGYPWRAQCRCGWKSPSYIAEHAAQAMLDHHTAG